MIVINIVLHINEEIFIGALFLVKIVL